MLGRARLEKVAKECRRNPDSSVLWDVGRGAILADIARVGALGRLRRAALARRAGGADPHCRAVAVDWIHYLYPNSFVWLEGIGRWAVRAFVAFVGVLVQVTALNIETLNVTELGKGGPKERETCAVLVDKLCLGQRAVEAGLAGPLQETPDEWLAACGFRFAKMLPQIGQDVVWLALRPGGGAADHKTGGAELVSRPAAGSRQGRRLVDVFCKLYNPVSNHHDS